jgi:hypothetical protein
MSRYKFAASLIIACIVVVPLTARAQGSDVAGEFYSTGVEAYFRGSSAEAESLLSNVIRVDPKDPRAYYFRALSRIGQGREAEARSDMQIGAQVEARNPFRFDIGKTLERVQGPTRLLLEQYRSRARATAGMNPPVGPVKAPDTAVLRERRIVPLEEFSHPGQPNSIAAPEIITPPAAPATKPPVNSRPAEAAQVNPFSDEGAAEPAPKTQPKAPPAKAPAALTPPPAKAPTPPAPKPAAPTPKSPDDNPFL